MSRREQVSRRHHKLPCFVLRLVRERYMDRHLVTVEVSIECRTDQWMQLNSTTFNQNRFKGLNTQAVQRWCTVQQNWMIFNDLFQHIPHFWFDTLYKTLGALDIVCK